MHRYEMCQGKSMFSPVLNLQFIYEVAVLLLFDFRCLPFLLRTRCSIICISCIMYNYWAYLKVLQYAEEILRLAKVSLLCQGCGICANFGNKPDALPSMRPGGISPFMGSRKRACRWPYYASSRASLWYSRYRPSHSALWDT